MSARNRREVRPFYVPAPWEETADSGRLILRDGTTATIRLSRRGDRAALQKFFDRLSPESRYRRFLSASLPPSDFIASLCDSSNPRTAVTLLALQARNGADYILASGSYFARNEQTAEVALVVGDQSHGLGLGTLLLERLALLAARQGFTRLWAMTDLANLPMLEVFRNSGFELSETLQGNQVEVDLSALPTEASLTLSDMRHRVATIASLRPFFQPRSVAVIGASRDPSAIGRRLFDALTTTRFTGAVYPVNTKSSQIAGLPAFSSVRALPQPVDLAIIAVPREAVLEVTRDCAAHGVKALIVITAGFAETDAQGRALQQQLLELVRGSGMRMVGPNCMGLLNTHPDVRLNATFSAVFPPMGRIAMSSQSGALGLAILAMARRRDLGLSAFVSIGNKADVSTNDLLEYWEEDEATGAILLYLESFGNPRRFGRIARRVSRRKPIVAVKAGRTSAGKRAAQSHTAALAVNDIAVDALFRQTGVLRAETLDELFDLAATLDSQPLPAGRRVAIVTNAGGPAILCADACAAGNLTLPELSEAAQAKLTEWLPPSAAAKNPIDMIASAGPEHYRRTVEAVLAAEEVDALIVMYIPVDPAVTDSIVDAISDGMTAGRAAGGKGKPVLACVMTDDGAGRVLQMGHERVPAFAFPEAAARALSKISAHAEWRSQPLGIIPDCPDVRTTEAHDVCRKALQERGAGWLSTEDTRAVLTAMHLPLAPGGLAHSAEEAEAIAQSLGYPVAVKLASRRLIHKSEIGGVCLNLQNPAAVREAYARIRDRLVKDNNLHAMEGVLVQPMFDGVEVMAGVTQDPLFGPLLGFGLGGIHVEVLGDVQFRVTPLTDRDAADMVRSIRGYRLLQGYRGHPPADIAALQDLLLRLSRLVEEVPEIKELDLNPIIALPPGQGCRIVDARIRVEQ